MCVLYFDRVYCLFRIMIIIAVELGDLDWRLVFRLLESKVRMMALACIIQFISIPFGRQYDYNLLRMGLFMSFGWPINRAR